MQTKHYLFVEDLKEFSKASIAWCVNESETASTCIATTIDLLLEDTKRVSALSESSLNAVGNLRKDLSKVPDTQAKKFTSLIEGLVALCTEHDEVRSMIDPILKALQFQDRMKQNLDNIIKMLALWLEYREVIATEGYGTDQRKAFGTSLHKVTTMAEERDLIQKFFPEAERPQESNTPAISFF